MVPQGDHDFLLTVEEDQSALYIKDDNALTLVRMPLISLSFVISMSLKLYSNFCMQGYYT